MRKLNEIRENSFISELAEIFPRSRHQCNLLHESDAELIHLPGTNIILAVKTDSIVEEIQSGLYGDPYLIGWMTVTVNVSDLAAVGAKPLGLLLNQTLPPDIDRDYLKKLQEGIRDACEHYGFCVLGGDTNFSNTMQMGAAAIGIIPSGKPMTRMGCRCDDLLFASGPLGLGSAYALLSRLGEPKANKNSMNYKPVARIKEGLLLREYASCCMDTSDGALATLDQLMRLNNIGFEINVPMEDLLDPAVLKIAGRYNLPPWIFLAGPHGEFELIFSIPPVRLDEFLLEAGRINWMPVQIGRVGGKPEVRIINERVKAILPTGKIRNLFDEVNQDAERYLKNLLEINNEIAAK